MNVHRTGEGGGGGRRMQTGKGGGVEGIYDNELKEKQLMKK